MIRASLDPAALGGSAALVATTTLLAALAPVPLAARQTAAPPTGRAAVEALSFEPLIFEPPEVSRRDVGGARVLFLEERALPLVTVAAYVEGR